MPVKLPKEALFRIKGPANLHPGMIRDVEHLYAQPAFTSCITLIVCFIDALAAGRRGADKTKFLTFLERHFRALCDELHAAVPAKSGAHTFYEEFRNGLAHLRGPRSGYALARNDETGGKYIEVFDVDGYGRLVGLNVDRLVADFLAMLRPSGGGTT